MNEMINAVRYDRFSNFANGTASVVCCSLTTSSSFRKGRHTDRVLSHVNALYDAQKQIVLSSDRPRMKFLTLEERLSRVSSGG